MKTNSEQTKMYGKVKSKEKRKEKNKIKLENILIENACRFAFVGNLL